MQKIPKWNFWKFLVNPEGKVVRFWKTDEPIESIRQEVTALVREIIIKKRGELWWLLMVNKTKQKHERNATLSESPALKGRTDWTGISVAGGTCWATNEQESGLFQWKPRDAAQSEIMDRAVVNNSLRWTFSTETTSRAKCSFSFWRVDRQKFCYLFFVQSVL